MSVSFDNIEERNKFIEQNMGLVAYVLKHYVYIGMDEYEDLFQEGCIGLILAAERYDDTCGIQFSTYAIPNITGYIKRYKRDKGVNLHGLKVARSIKDDQAKVETFMNKNPDCEIQDIIKAVGITYERLGVINALKVQSIDNTIDTHTSKEDKTLKALDILGSSDTSYEEVEAEIVTNEVLQALKKKLPKREYDIAEEIIYAYLIGGERITQDELAIKYKVSQAQISRQLGQIKKTTNEVMKKLYGIQINMEERKYGKKRRKK